MSYLAPFAEYLYGLVTLLLSTREELMHSIGVKSKIRDEKFGIIKWDMVLSYGTNHILMGLNCSGAKTFVTMCIIHILCICNRYKTGKNRWFFQKLRFWILDAVLHIETNSLLQLCQINCNDYILVFFISESWSLVVNTNLLTNSRIIHNFWQWHMQVIAIYTMHWRSLKQPTEIFVITR